MLRNFGLSQLSGSCWVLAGWRRALYDGSQQVGIECVIFDLDGTLVDSEGLCNRVFLEMVPELEFSIEEMVERYSGVKMALILEDLERVVGKALPGGFLISYRARLAELMEAELEPMPGVGEMLEALDLPVCVASNAPLKKVRTALEACSLDSFFGEKVFSAYEINCWKPEPGLFLHAAEKMGYLAGSCAVIEDSPTGIVAALAAGTKPFLYSRNGRVEAEPGVVEFREMGELPGLLVRD